MREKEAAILELFTYAMLLLLWFYNVFLIV